MWIHYSPLPTQDGTILATFQQQIQEIDFLIEEHDLVILNMRQDEPFVNNPPLLRVTSLAIAASLNPSIIQFEPTEKTGSTLDPPDSVPQSSEAVSNVSTPSR